jgi:hypothetical protein
MCDVVPLAKSATLVTSREMCGRRCGRYPLSNNASVELAGWFIEMDQAPGELAEVCGRLHEQSFRLYELGCPMVRQLVEWR